MADEAIPETVVNPNGTKDFIHKLTPPLTLASGKVIEQLDLNFDHLKAKGIKAVATQFRAVVKEFTAVPWADERYQLMAAARLNGLIYEDMDELGGKDTVAVLREALNFFGERD